MTEMRKTFKIFGEAVMFKNALRRDKNNSCFQLEYDNDIKLHVLTWTHREECKDQKSLEEF